MAVMMSALTETVRDAVWNRRGTAGRFGWLALQPAVGGFAAAVAVRNLAYTLGVLRVRRAPIGVVSVGNLSVGGTGKTPVTLWLARALAAEGDPVGILLRGHGGSARTATLVSRGRGVEAEVGDVGDEAVMLAKGFDGVVVVARRRPEGAALAAELGCRVVVLDDGFQHRALARNFDLVLVDGRGGALLPAGPMREPWSSLKRADAVAVIDKDGDGNVLPQALPKQLPTFRVRFVPTAIVEVDGAQWRERPLSVLSGAHVALVCGIARPGPFYQAVRKWEPRIGEVFEYPDHHVYTEEDWHRLSRAARDVDYLVTTEKDLVKLERFPFAREKLVALRIVPEIEDGDRLVHMVRERVLSPATVTAEKEK